MWQRGASVGEEKLFVRSETAIVALKLLEEEVVRARAIGRRKRCLSFSRASVGV